jgi:hypothetical protein
VLATHPCMTIMLTIILGSIVMAVAGNIAFAVVEHEAPIAYAGARDPRLLADLRGR